MGLATYRRKRNFTRTPEPRGAAARPHAKLRYVIQKHAASHLHYDFRLELDGALKSWAVPKGPSLDPADKRLAVEVEDHPLEYAKFEGTIPKGEYGGGTVLLWDRGTWTPIGDPHHGLEKGHLSFELRGEKLRGEWHLVRMGRRSAEEGKPQWLLVKHDGEGARTGGEAIVAERPESVSSGRTIEQVAAGVGRSREWRSGRPARRASASRFAAFAEHVAEKRAPRDSVKGRTSARDKGAKRATHAKRAKTAPAVDPSALPGARRGGMPRFVPPQLATLNDRAPGGEGWLHEIKYDGYRTLCRLENGVATLYTRTGQDWTERFGSVAEDAAALPASRAWLDGEIVVLEANGVSSFQALQNVLSRADTSALVYFAFDLVHLDGWDLSGVPLERRKAALRELLEGAGPSVRFSDHVTGRGDLFHGEACQRGLEGIVSKRADGHYTSRRTRDWLKTKCSARQEFVIGGFTEPQGARTGLGALLVGVRDDGGFRYCGRVGTGFDNDTLRDLRRRLEPLETSKTPFVNPPRGRDVHWVKPRLVAEVAFTERTKDGLLRHPSFQGLREDKPARQVVDERPTARARRGGGKPPVREPGSRPPVREPDKKPPARDPVRQPPVREPDSEPPMDEPDREPPMREPEPGGAKRSAMPRGLALTHPDKVLYPDRGLTKLDLARHLHSVADLMLPQVVDRPLMLKRCPEGTAGKCFFQKHPKTAVHPALARIEVREADGGTDTYLTVKDTTGLLSLVQMGVLEVHVWGARADRIEHPDRIVFDVDPDPGTPWAEVAATARRLRERLEEIGLESWLKTTGGKGLHVVVPIRRGPGWEDVKAFSSGVAAGLVREAPDRWTTQLAKARRGGRLFIDTLRNSRGATWVAPYSPRARAGAPVSAPIRWEELDARMRPDRFTVENFAARLARRVDPWKDIDATRQALTASMLREAQSPSVGGRRRRVG